MNTSRSIGRIGFIFTLLLSATMGLAAPRDRKAPTTPTNLRVTATTAWSVSLAWNPSTDASPFTYYAYGSNGQTVTVPQTQTSVTFNSGFQHRGTYSFIVFAIDAAGNRSYNSNTVTVTLPQDTIAPTAPVITVTGVGPTHADLSLAATDDGPFIFYSLYVDGVLHSHLNSATWTRVHLLEPSTTYSFTAQARDNGINWSPMSTPVSVTTLAADQSDVTPPSPPTNLWAAHFSDGSTEFEAMWTASTDDRDPAQLIRYDVYLNGAFLGTIAGHTRFHDYGVFGENVFEVIARDTAGNESGPAAFILHIP